MADQPLIISIGSLVGAVMGLIKAEWDSSAVVKKLDELEKRIESKIRDLKDDLEKRIEKLEQARTEASQRQEPATRRGSPDLRAIAARLDEIEDELAARPRQRSGSFPAVDLGAMQSRLQSLEMTVSDLLRRVGQLENFERGYHDDYTKLVGKVHELLGRLGRRRHVDERESEG